MALVWPFFGSRGAVDIATLILIYVMLGLGLNIVVGLAGLLDLGYIAFLGGNVNFYPNTTGIFTSNGNGNSKPTNILQAIPYSSVAANRSRIYGVNSLIGSAAGTVAVQGP